MISVCMATYNGGRFIKEQIDSILPQLSENDELIISDDGSTDRTLEIIASYKDERIKIFHHQKNPEYAKIKHSQNFYYATSNFENALKQARGDYIFLSDQDDVWMPNKVKICIEKIKNADLVMHNLSLFSDDINKSFILYKTNPIPKLWWKNLIQMNFWGCCMAFKKSVLDFSIPFPRNIIGHDYWVSTIALKFFKVLYISDPLILHRSYEGSVSYKAKNSFLFKIYFRCKIFFEIFKKSGAVK